MNVPTLNPATIVELNAIEPGIPSELAALFLNDAPPILAALQTAVARHDLPAVRRLASHLRESCTALGATTLAGLCDGPLPGEDRFLWLFGVNSAYGRVAAVLEALA